MGTRWWVPGGGDRWPMVESKYYIVTNLDCHKLRLLQPVSGYQVVGTGGWVPGGGYRWPLVESKYYIVTNLDC